MSAPPPGGSSAGLPPPPPLGPHEAAAADRRDGWLADPSVGHWRRLHPLSPVVRAGRGVVPLFAVLLIDLLARRGIDYGRLIGDGVVVAVLLLLGVVSWLVTRWRVENGVLHIETGLLRRRSLRYPLTQVQAIDLVQTGFARLFGLAELRLRMAGGADRGGGRLQGLKFAEAQLVRSELLTAAHRADRPSAAGGSSISAAEELPPAPTADSDRPPSPDNAEYPLFTVPTGRLVGSVALSLLGLLVATMVLAVIFVAAFDPAAAGVLISSAAALVVGLGTGLYRRLNGEYQQTVTFAPDGFRLSSGLVEKTSETIPPGRVQGIRLVEPVLWRPFGWFRLEVEVAGKRVREENRSQGRQRRALLPVGPASDVRVLLDHLVPDPPRLDRRPPRRSRWKAPLSYRNLAWGANDRCVVTRSGRIRRTTHWVPLAKVQSLRRVQGPLQRRLRLGSLHLDTAGRSIHALIRDVEFEVVAAQTTSLPPLCRAARERVVVRGPAAANEPTGQA